MKKNIIVFLILMLIPTCVFASTNTYERTQDDFRVNKSNITIDSTNQKIILRTPSVDASEKIYDYADLFTEDEEVDLYKIINNFISSYNMDFALVTINNNPYDVDIDYSNNKDHYSMAFADDFYDYNDFGVGDDYSGVLFLIDMENRYIWISSTGSAENYFYYETCYEILDSSADLFTSGDYYDGVLDSIYLMSEEFDENLSEKTGVSYFTTKDKAWLQSSVCISLVVSVIASIVFVIINVSKCRMAKQAKSAAGYTNVNSINMVNDVLIDVHNSTTYVGSSSSSSGGSHHSGGHISSSGSHHSGGGHHF